MNGRCERCARWAAAQCRGRHTALRREGAGGVNGRCERCVRWAAAQCRGRHTARRSMRACEAHKRRYCASDIDALKRRVCANTTLDGPPLQPRPSPLTWITSVSLPRPPTGARSQPVVKARNLRFCSVDRPCTTWRGVGGEGLGCKTESAPEWVKMVLRECWIGGGGAHPMHASPAPRPLNRASQGEPPRGHGGASALPLEPRSPLSISSPNALPSVPLDPCLLLCSPPHPAYSGLPARSRVSFDCWGSNPRTAQPKRGWGDGRGRGGSWPWRK